MVYTPFKMISMSGGAVFGMSGGRTLSYVKPHSGSRTEACQDPVDKITNGNIPSMEKIKKGKKKMEEVVQQMEKVNVRKTKRRPIEF